MILFLLMVSVIFSPVTQAFVPGADILNSPVLLLDYREWAQDQAAFQDENSERGSFKKLVEILYDFEIGRPWGRDYFPAATSRLRKFQEKNCHGFSVHSICKISKNLENLKDLEEVQESLRLKGLQLDLGTRWGAFLSNPTFKNNQRKFNYLLSTKRIEIQRENSFWSGNLKKFNFFFDRVLPVSDVDTYLGGFESKEYPAHFALVGESIHINDWLLRNRSMEFANDWKKYIDRKSKNPHPIFDSTEIFFRDLFEESKFLEKYDLLLAQLPVSSSAYQRFLMHREGGAFPEEVFQHVAYDLLRETLLLQSSFLKDGLDRYPDRSIRQISLESILTLFKESKSKKFIRMELMRRLDPLASYAAVLDQMIGQDMAFTYAIEEANALLGQEGYSSLELFDSFLQSLSGNLLFDDYYLNEFVPHLLHFFRDNGGKRIEFSDLSLKDKKEVLASSLKKPDGKVDVIGLFRFCAVISVSLPENLQIQLAQIIHSRRYP